jgi:hypothetical protein
MSAGFYRVLIVLFIVLGPFIMFCDTICVPGEISGGFGSHPLFFSAVLISLALQPISAVGLWNARRWGLITLGVAMILVFAVPPVAIGAIIVLAASPFRFDEAKIERRKTARPYETVGLPEEEPGN